MQKRTAQSVDGPDLKLLEREFLERRALVQVQAVRVLSRPRSERDLWRAVRRRRGRRAERVDRARRQRAAVPCEHGARSLAGGRASGEETRLEADEATRSDAFLIAPKPAAASLSLAPTLRPLRRSTRRVQARLTRSDIIREHRPQCGMLLILPRSDKLTRSHRSQPSEACRTDSPRIIGWANQKGVANGPREDQDTRIVSSAAVCKAHDLTGDAEAVRSWCKSTLQSLM